jgi:DNA-binding transcriptional ArsR family regulator
MRERAAAIRACAPLFAALGDPTRLAVLSRLSAGQPESITRITAGTRLTRQAVTKHLQVLEGVGIVRAHKVGRESLFRLHPEALEPARRYIDGVSRSWDEAVQRLRLLVEE